MGDSLGEFFVLLLWDIHTLFSQFLFHLRKIFFPLRKICWANSFFWKNLWERSNTSEDNLSLDVFLENLALVLNHLKMYDHILPQFDGQEFWAIRSLPPEYTVRKGKGSFSVQLRGHKIIYSAFFKNLGQSPAKTKGIREPAYSYLHSKFIQEILFPVKYLPNKGFSRGQITVQLYPHSTNYFPFSFFKILQKAANKTSKVRFFRFRWVATY